MSSLKNILHDKKVIIIIILSIFMLVLGLFLYVFNNQQIKKNSRETIDLILFGNQKIIINQGEKYIEPGYYAINNKGEIKTSEVVVTPTEIDTNKAGTYYINYVIGNKIRQRIVVVNQKEEKGILSLNLKGDNPMFLKVGEEYVEPGYEAFDTVDGILTNFVKVTGTINTGERGIYTLTYEVKNKDGELITKTRIINVE